MFCGTEQAGFFAIDWRQLTSAWHMEVERADPKFTDDCHNQQNDQQTELVIFGAKPNAVRV